MKILLIFLFPLLIGIAPTITELSLAESVASTDEVCDDSLTPVTGKEVRLQWFEGNASQDPDTTIVVYWDFNQAGEVVVWSTHGSVMAEVDLLIGTGDGTKKVALCLINDDSVSRILSGKARVYTK